MILKQVLAQWWCLVGFKKAMKLLHWAMHAVWYQRTNMTIETASKVGTFYIVFLFAVAMAAVGAIWSK